MTDLSARALSADEAIEINVPLHAEHAATLRVIVASLGSDHGLSIDEIDDLKLAVSEVFTVLIDDADDSDARRAAVRYWVADGAVRVHLQRDVNDTPIELDTLATTILTSVVDEHVVDDTGISLVKQSSELSS